MKKALTLFTLFILFSNLVAQNEVTSVDGIILDLDTKIPIPYVNIGFVNEGIGTVSNSDGTFKLNFYTNSLNLNSTLKISCIGYKSLEMTASKFSENHGRDKAVYLKQVPYELDEVIVTNDLRKEKSVGSLRLNPLVIGYWLNAEALGGEIATKIPIANKNTLLHELSFFVANNNSGAIKIRVNVYDYKDGLPGKNLLTQNIFHTITVKSGLETINLDPFRIRVDDDIIVSLELIEVNGQSIDFEISGSFYNTDSFIKEISFDEWKPYVHQGLAIKLLTSFPSKQGKILDKKRAIPKKLTLYWDTSLTMKDPSRNIEKELSLLDKYLNNLNKVEVKVLKFNNENLEQRIFNIEGDNKTDIIEYLKNSSYVGESNFSDVLKSNNYNADAALVFTSAMTQLEPLQQSVYLPVFYINSLENANHYALQTASFYGNGYYVNLSDVSVKEGLKMMLFDHNDTNVYEKIDGTHMMNQEDIKKDDLTLTSVNRPSNKPTVNGGLRYNLKVSREIKGKITYLGQPLKDVNIIIKGTVLGTKTNELGEYSIQAKINEQIQYTYSGFQPVTILVEDVTNVLNIEMDNYITELDEVVVETTANNNSTEMDFNSLIKTSNTSFNPMTLKDVKQYSPEDIETQYGLLSDGLKLYYPKGLPTENFDIDGELCIGERLMDLHTIQNVYFIPDAFNYYRDFLDPVSNKSIIVIRTTKSQEYKDIISEKYKNRSFYNYDAMPMGTNAVRDTIITETIKGELKTITGLVTYLRTPIRDVNILVKGTTTGTRTNRNGKYSINAKVGDVIQFSHIAYKTVNIQVEDVTQEINIEMIDNANELDEVVITVKTIEGKVMKYRKKAEEKFATSRGNIDPKIAGYAIGFVDGEDISNSYPSIQEALRGKISGYVYDLTSDRAYLRGVGSSINQDYPVAWEVDGVFTTDTPVALDLSQILSVYALKSLAATNKYGSQGAGGVIVIFTKNGDFGKNSNLKNITEQYANQNFYNNDAEKMAMNEIAVNAYTNALMNLNNKQKALDYYRDQLHNAQISLDQELSIAKVFMIYYSDSSIALEILAELSTKYSGNPEYLKAIAYQMQSIGKNINTVELYEDIFLLRPRYVQSYRDLANAYLETDQFKKAWRLYMRYFLQGHDLNNTSIGEIMYNEMEYLYYVRKERAEIKEQFVPKSKNLEDFRVDMRIVFEWNTSEAEFDLEFVSPDLRSYIFEHSLAYDEDLITDEKEKGYSSKEFIIDEIGDGQWLVNLTYHGNKKSDPTYFKVTEYYNWGKPTQRQEIKVFELSPDQNQKLQLLKLNKQLLVAHN